MSDQAGILPKWFFHWGIILAKGQLGHSYTFWTMPILILSPVQIIMRHPLTCEYGEIQIWLFDPVIKDIFWKTYLQHFIASPSNHMKPNHFFFRSSADKFHFCQLFSLCHGMIHWSKRWLIDFYLVVSVFFSGFLFCKEFFFHEFEKEQVHDFAARAVLL